VYECHSLADVKRFVTAQTLVLFDLDNTLMEPTQTLGSDEWFHQQLSDYTERGLTRMQAIQELLPIWHRIVQVSPFQVLEEDTADLVADVQAQAAYVTAVTARGPELIQATRRHLRQVGVVLSGHALPVIDQDQLPLAYDQGVLLCNGVHKGKALLRLLEHTSGLDFDRIVFVDDLEKNVRAVEEAASELGVEFIGLRYSAADHKQERYHHGVAHVQMKAFNFLMPDHLAEAFLEGEYEAVFEHWLDHMHR
jgi:FMN phosphatase YigB (HAD superfamily)